MAFCQIGVSCEPKVIGVNNGIYQCEIDKKQFGNEKYYTDFVLSFSREESINDCLNRAKKPLLANLLKKAKITDFMGYAPNLRGIPFAVSKNALRILQKFNLGEFNTIELKFSNSEVGSYYLIWFPFIEADMINFKQSILYYRSRLTQPKEYHLVGNYEEYLALFEKYRFNTFFKKISLNASKENCDFVQMRVGGNFISKRLLEALIDNGMTGLTVKTQIELDYK